MEESLLLTKLYIPTTGPRLVSRQRLINHLNEGLTSGAKITLISATVGYGKTTLVSDWLSTLNTQVAWLSLDPEDNELIRFWIYFIAALQTIQPELGQAALTLFQAQRLPPIENIIGNLINQITTITTSMIMVLDDYHLLDSNSIHQSLKFLLDNVPPNLHLILITREDPPLPLSQMRAKGQIVELRAKDLRFTIEESTQFLIHRMNLNLRTRDIAVLQQRTDGWVAGLQMAALSLRNVDDPSGFVEAYAGDDRYVMDYLIDEVLARQPQDIQEFLMQTAILQRFTAPLCDAITGKDSGRYTLAYLEDTNLFLIPLDNKRQWYRYHPLFGDLLNFRLRDRLGVESINNLHQVAADWLTKNGFTDEAINHYLVSGSLDQAADLMEPIVVNLIAQGQLGKVLTWLTKFPDDYTCSRPLLSVSHAWVLSVTGQGTAAEIRLREAKQCISATQQIQAKEIFGLILLVQSYLARNKGDVSQSIQLLQDSKEIINSDNLTLRSSVNLNLGFNFSIIGELRHAEQSLRAAQSEGQAINAVYLIQLAMATRGMVYVAQGELRQAVQMYQKAIEYGLIHNKGQPFPPAGYSYAGLGQVLYEQNDLDVAEQHLKQAVDFGELMGDWSMKRRGLLPLAWLKLIKGDSAGAQELWQRALSVVQQADSRRIEVQLMAQRAWMNLAHAAISPSNRSSLIVAEDWAESYRQSKPDESSYQETFAQFTLAWVELTQGLVDHAFNRLELQITISANKGWTDNLIKLLALKALACHKQGNIKEALYVLEKALAIAAPKGYIRSFVDYGLPMYQLLTQASERVIVSNYIDNLLSAFPEATGKNVSEEMQKFDIPQVIDEYLTHQEITILRYMAAGLSHNEIATELYLSINTIKWHTTHIYSKLGVHRREHAVSRARELGIL